MAGVALRVPAASLPAPPPPAPPILLRDDARLPAVRPALPAASPVWSIGEPSDEEQVLLELINRARANPAAEAIRLRTTTAAGLLQAYAFFLVDLDRFQADLSALPPLPPLAFHPLLLGPARSHSQYQLVNAVQTHFQGSQSVRERVEATGYPWAALGENVYAFAEDPPQAHAGFEVDWGLFGPDGLPVAPGMQDPPGHRLSNHSAAFREAGIGWLPGNNTVITPTATNSVGPNVVTVVFGARSGAQPLITGVVYYDLNGNGFYDAGEGVGGVDVEVAGAQWSGRSSASGGYAVPVSNGIGAVTFRGPGLAPVERAVTVANGDNAKLDLALAYPAPVLAGPPTALAGVAADYSVTAVPGAVGFEWERSRRVAYGNVLGGESGQAGAVVAQVSGYPATQSLIRHRGDAAYRLASPVPEDQLLTLAPTFLGGGDPRLRFASRLGVADPAQEALVEISTDGGATWLKVWSRKGTGVPGETDFTNQEVPLPSVTGRSFQLRFRYSSGLQYYPQTDPGVGWYFDEVALSGVFELRDTTVGTAPATGWIGVTFPAAGDWMLRARPRVGPRQLPFGPSVVVTVAPFSGTAPVVRIRRQSLEPDGRIRLVFAVESGAASSFRLDWAASLGGPWAEVPVPPPTLVGGEGTFVVPPSGTTGFYRVRVP